MPKRSISKRLKSAMAKRKSEKTDRISALPDALLCHILSFLQTKEAVATSILSTRWRSLWTSVLTLDLSDDWSCFSKTSSFSDVVNKVLAQRKVPCIKRFCLSSYNQLCDPNLVRALVSIAVSRGLDLEELDLSFYFYLEATLPAKLFCFCKTISVLKLSGRINWNLPSSVKVHFPSLKILGLIGLHFADDGPLRKLLSGCPILEEFSVHVNIDHSPSFRICVPSLKTLYITCSRCDVERLEIDTPSLEVLRVEGVSVKDYLVQNLHNLAEARIDIFFELNENKEEDGGDEDKDKDKDDNKNVAKLFEGIHKTNFLWLSEYSTEVLTWACLGFPEFQNLVHLQLLLITLDPYFLVESLLEKCPKLEILEIEKLDEESDINWAEPRTPVPTCLSSHLTVFKFRKFQGSKQELELAKYILKNAKVLQSATFQIVSWLERKTKRSVHEKLCLIPKASKHCEKFQILDEH